jgi:hypothetical protein
MHLLKGEKQYPGFPPILKAVLFWAVFMLLYFAYKYFPVFPLSLICSINESNFQHYKAAFFAFLILNLIEFAIYHRQIQDKKRHILSRLTATTFAPWVVFLLWYIAPAMYGKMPTIPLEIIYANIITLLVGYFVTSLEQGFVQIRYSSNLCILILILFTVSIILYVSFTFKLPWADVFIEPDWR